jgi:hypothetical protein
MITQVSKPFEDVVRAIVDYTDPDSGFNIFGLMGFRSGEGSLRPYHASLDDPDTLTGREYAVEHKFHSENCAITDPKDPRYLNGGAIIADINYLGWADPTQTQIRWRPDHMHNPQHRDGYQKLQSLLESLNE